MKDLCTQIIAAAQKKAKESGLMVEGQVKKIKCTSPSRSSRWRSEGLEADLGVVCTLEGSGKTSKDCLTSSILPSGDHPNLG